MRAARWGVGAAAFALVAVASYTLQRLWSWWGGEPAFGTIVASATTPYYWRADVAALHGLTVGLLVGLGLEEEQAKVWLVRVPWLVFAVVAPSALAMVLVP